MFRAHIFFDFIILNLLFCGPEYGLSWSMFHVCLKTLYSAVVRIMDCSIIIVNLVYGIIQVSSSSTDVWGYLFFQLLKEKY